MDTNGSTGDFSDGSTVGADGSLAGAGFGKSRFSEAKRNSVPPGESLRSHLAELKVDLDTLLERSPGMSDEELAQAHSQLMMKFSSVRYAAKGIADEATRQLNRGVETTTEYVKDKPVQSVAVAVGTGLLLGWMMKRR